MPASSYSVHRGLLNLSIYAFDSVSKDTSHINGKCELVYTGIYTVKGFDFKLIFYVLGYSGVVTLQFRRQAVDNEMEHCIKTGIGKVLNK